MDHSTLSDQELVALSLHGDLPAFSELVERYQKQVYTLAYRMLSNDGDAAEAAQEAFFRAYRHLRRYDMTRPFSSWLLSISSNYCIDHLRKRRLVWQSLDDMLPAHQALTSSEPGPEEQALNHEQTMVIAHLLDTLPPHHRAAVILRCWYDLPYEELAEILRVKRGTVASWLFRARQALAAECQSSQAAQEVLMVETR